jgi:hypothetical protein
MVRAMVAYGVKQIDICAVLNTSKPTLEKHFAEEIATAAVEANAKVAESLFRSALDGNTTAQLFWLKTRAGWCERQVIEGGDAPLRMVVEWATPRDSKSE